MPAKRGKAFSWCTNCGNWAFNFRIIRNDGKCAKCYAEIPIFEKPKPPPSAITTKPPWRDGGHPYSSPDPTQLLAQLASLPAFKGMSDMVQQLRTKYEEENKPKPREVNLREKVQSTQQILTLKNKALEHASQAVTVAEQALATAQDRCKQAAYEQVEAKEAHDKAVKELACHVQGGPPSQLPPDGYTMDGKKIVFAIDETLFADLGDDFDDTQKQELLDIEKAIEEKCRQVQDLQRTVHDQYTKVRAIRSSPNKRLRGATGAVATGEEKPKEPEPAAGPTEAKEEEASAAAVRAAQEAERKAAADAKYQEAVDTARAKTRERAQAAGPAPAAPSSGSAGPPAGGTRGPRRPVG